VDKCGGPMSIPMVTDHRQTHDSSDSSSMYPKIRLSPNEMELGNLVVFTTLGLAHSCIQFSLTVHSSFTVKYIICNITS
jgi:hypothetical protein